MTPLRGGPWKTLGLALASVVLSLALAEGLLRVFRPAPLFLRLSFVDDGYTYVLSPNRKLVYEPKPNAGPLNATGHRGPAFPYEKGLKKRIVFMGDSVLEGLGVEPPERFTEILNQRLGHGYEVMNFGVEGYSFAQEFEYFKEKVLGFSPDHVIWCLTCNDLSEASSELGRVHELMDKIERNPFYKDYYRGQEKVESIFLSSHVYRHMKSFLRYALARKTNEKSTRSCSVSPDEAAAAEALGGLAALAQKRRFRLSFILLPADVSDDRNDSLRFAPWLRREHIAYADLNVRFSRVPDEKKSLFFKNDPCHLNRKGHQAVAELLFEQLRGKSRERRPLRLSD